MNQPKSPLSAPPRRFDAPGAPTAPRREGGDGEPRKLIVGRDISLAGEIGACDHLVVEGKVEAKLTGAKRVEIAESGTFDGSVDAQDATIAGRFQGELVVRGRLTVARTGRIEGKIRYGEIEVEAGGQIVGQIETAATAP